MLFLCAPRILAGLIIFAGYLLNEQGLIGLLLAGDRSGISYLIAAIWLAMTLRWLWLLRWVPYSQSQSQSLDNNNLYLKHNQQ